MIAAGGIGDARAIAAALALGGTVLSSRVVRSAARCGGRIVASGQNRNAVLSCTPAALIGPSSRIARLIRPRAGRPLSTLVSPDIPTCQRRPGSAPCQSAGERFRRFLGYAGGPGDRPGPELPGGALIARLATESRALLRRMAEQAGWRTRLSR